MMTRAFRLSIALGGALLLSVSATQAQNVIAAPGHWGQGASITIVSPHATTRLSRVERARVRPVIGYGGTTVIIVKPDRRRPIFVPHPLPQTTNSNPGVHQSHGSFANRLSVHPSNPSRARLGN